MSGLRAGLRFPAYIRGLSAPLRTLGLFLFHSISYGDQGLSRIFWVFSTEFLRFLGDLTPLPPGSSNPSGSLSPKVFSRFSFDFFDLLLNFINA
jgi:hypothetical protein